VASLIMLCIKLVEPQVREQSDKQAVRKKEDDEQLP